MSAPMILFSLDPRKVHDERSRRLLGKHFYAITGNPRLDIKQTLTAAGNHSGLTLRHSVALSLSFERCQTRRPEICNLFHEFSSKSIALQTR